MQYSATGIDYQELTERLQVSRLSPSAAEAQGMLCAMLCAGTPRAEELWVAELLPDADHDDPATDECRRRLQDLAVRTSAQLRDPDVLFTPLLPDGAQPLADRALGLYDFSRGFLYGLGLVTVDRSQLSNQAQEAFDDFAQITHLDLEDLQDCEDNEQALTELMEYVRVATVLLYEERTATPRSCH